MNHIPANIQSRIGRERRAAIYLNGLAEACAQAGEQSLCAAMIRDRDIRQQRALDLIEAVIPIDIPPFPPGTVTVIDLPRGA